MKALFGKLLGMPMRGEVPSVPAGCRVYAIGDIHGRDDLLGDLLSRIEADIASRPSARNLLVFLGDLIDRGPASREVVERLINYRPDGVRLIFLAGNHEEVLLRILDGEVTLIADWLKFGGSECLQSYGLAAAKLKRMTPARAAEAIRSAIPTGHREFLNGFADTFRAGDYLFVHAGIRPGVSLDEQAQVDLRWIRQPFLSHRGDEGFVVVHGHTICERVEDLGNRIGIDTGAYRTGVLTALGIQNGERWFLQTGEPSISAEIAAESDGQR